MLLQERILCLCQAARGRPRRQICRQQYI
jgi:hypothetical protein